MDCFSQKRITVITGHYGSGKTTVAVNMAKEFRSMGQEVCLIDLDIVNPYFRSADFSDELEKLGVKTVLPTYAKSNLDIPALTAGVDAAIADEKYRVIIDVGGDDSGAIALGRYSALIDENGYEMLYVVNAYRYLTITPDEALSLMKDIEGASRLKASGLVNNSNLGYHTTAEDISKTEEYMRSLSLASGLPVVFTAADIKQKGRIPGANGRALWMDTFTLPEWAQEDD